MMKTKRSISFILTALILLSVFPGMQALAAVVGDKEITAAGAFVMDYETGLGLYAHNADTRRVPASTTKLAAVYVVYDAIKRGDIALDSPVTISKGVSTASNNREYSNVPLAAGSSVTVKQLLEFVMIHSACASTTALGEALYGSEAALVARMNEKMKELGVDAAFHDSFGGSPDNRISPRGLAILAANLISDHPEVLSISSTPAFVYNNVEYKSTNQLLQTYAGIDGLKTGYTSAAGYCFVGTAVQNGRRLISVTMGSTKLATRFPDVEALLDYGFSVVDGIVAEYISSLPAEEQPEPPPAETPVDIPPEDSEPPVFSTSGMTQPSSAVITVNGLPITVTAYNIDGYHYFKLRDIAFLLNGTEKQFEAAWDSDTNFVHLTSLVPYTSVGDELTLAQPDTYYYYSSTASQIYLDSNECSFIVYNIDDYNYFKLRDIATLIDFGVGWDEESRTVLIDTSLGYFDTFNDSDEDLMYPDSDTPDGELPDSDTPDGEIPGGEIPLEPEQDDETAQEPAPQKIPEPPLAESDENIPGTQLPELGQENEPAEYTVA